MVYIVYLHLSVHVCNCFVVYIIFTIAADFDDVYFF